MTQEWYEDFYTQDHIDIVGFASPEQTEREAAFVVDTLGIKSGSRICDLCCGFGRHTFEIARQSGCNMVGIDISDDYLAMARENYASSDIEFEKGDMRDINHTAEFDHVVNLFTSFGFFETDEENRKVLEQVNKALKSGGRFLLDYENRFYFVFNDVYKQSRSWRKVDDDNYYLVENTYDVLTEREIFKARLIHKGKEKNVTGYTIRLYSYPEIRRILEASGFELEEVWGGYDGAEYTAFSKRVILLSRKVRDL